MIENEYTMVWMGPVYEISGYGSVSRNFVKQFNEIGTSIKVVPYGKREGPFIDKEILKLLMKLESTEIKGKVIVVYHGLPDAVVTLRFHGAAIVIAMLIFETDSLPFYWKRILNKRSIQEVWVPSEFNIESFVKGGVKRSKLRKVPYGIPEDSVKIEAVDNSGIFRILYISNLGPRTATSTLVEAFIQEFSNEEDVELYLKVNSSDQNAIKDFLKGIPEESRIVVDTRKLDELQLKSLIKSAGLYISLDRANGWGMPNMEAMKLGVPTATVNWSGSTEFSNRNNSYLIEPTGKSEFILSRKHANSFFRLYFDQKWADIDIKDVRKVMRSAKEDKERNKEIVLAAYKTINEEFNFKVICSNVTTHLMRKLASFQYKEVNFNISSVSSMNKQARRLILDIEYAIRGFLKYGQSNPFMFKIKRGHLNAILNRFSRKSKSPEKSESDGI